MCPLGRGGPLVTSSKTEQTSLTPRGLDLLFSPALGCLWDLGLRVTWVWKQGPLTPC